MQTEHSITPEYIEELIKRLERVADEQYMVWQYQVHLTGKETDKDAKANMKVHVDKARQTFEKTKDFLEYLKQHS